MKRLLLGSLLLLGMFYKTSASPVITNNTQRVKTANEVEKLMDLFKGLDSKVLKSRDEKSIAEMFTKKNKEITDYVKSKYQVDLLEHYDLDDPSLSLIGFIVASGEQHSSSVQQQRNTIMTCIAAGFGIIQMAEFIQAGITEGVSTSMIINIVKKVGKRYLGWIGLGIAVYEFGACMDMW